LASPRLVVLFRFGRVLGPHDNQQKQMGLFEGRHRFFTSNKIKISADTSMFHFEGDNEMYTDKPRNVGGYKTTFSDRPIHHIYIIIHPNAGFPASRNILSKPEIR